MLLVDLICVLCLCVCLGLEFLGFDCCLCWFGMFSFAILVCLAGFDCFVGFLVVYADCLVVLVICFNCWVVD